MSLMDGPTDDKNRTKISNPIRNSHNLTTKLIAARRAGLPAGPRGRGGPERGGRRGLVAVHALAPGDGLGGPVAGGAGQLHSARGQVLHGGRGPDQRRGRRGGRRHRAGRRVRHPLRRGGGRAGCATQERQARAVPLGDE